MLSLRVRDAGRRFGARQVFSGLDLDVAAGERIFLAGANGSGKSTLLRCIAGTLALDTGSVILDGHAGAGREFRSRLGVCRTPEQALYPRLSGHDNLLLAARLRLPPTEITDAVRNVEHELGITPFAGKRVQEYSSGMRARVSTARALLGHPTLLLLDEPTRSLDTEARDLLWAALDRRRTACIIASHRDSDRENCDRTLTLPVHCEGRAPRGTSDDSVRRTPWGCEGRA